MTSRSEINDASRRSNPDVPSFVFAEGTDRIVGETVLSGVGLACSVRHDFVHAIIV